MDVSEHLANLTPEHVRFGPPINGPGARAFRIGEFFLTVGGRNWGAETLRSQAATLIAIANAANEAAHWCEDLAGDLEHQAAS